MGAFGLAGQLFGRLVEPGLRVRAGRCLRGSGSGCRQCVEICPAGALRLGPAGNTQAPQAEPSRCTDCGLCMASCPSGAITGVGVPAGAFTREAEHLSSAMRVSCAPARRGRFATESRSGSEPSKGPGSGSGRDSRGGTDSRGGLESGSGRGSRSSREPRREGEPGLSVSCLAALHPETVAATTLALRPGATLTLTRAQCSQCPASQRSRVETVVRESTDLLQRLDPGNRRIQLVTTSPDATERQPPAVARPGKARQNDWSRRDLFTVGRSRGRAAPPAAVTSARAELLGHSPDPSLVPLLLTHPVDAQGCTFCRACAAVCPTRALLLGPLAPDQLGLTVDPDRCVGCGRCAEVCVDSLLTLGFAQRPTSPGRGDRNRVVLLAQGAESLCGTCRQSLTPGERGVCSRCACTSALVADVLTR